MYIKPILEGEVFGERVVVEKSNETKNGYFLYLVKCKCGELSKVSGSYLRQYPNRKCRNCSLKDKNKKGRDHYNYKHGRATRLLGKQRIYHIWISMRERCLNPNAKQYKDYGGRGIKICPEWDDVEVFCQDMGERPSIRHTLDRIDNEKDYCKDNCKWSTLEEQARNKRTSVFYDLPAGVRIQKQTLIESLEWSSSMFRRRLENKNGKWGLDKIIKEYLKLTQAKPN